MAAEGSAGRQPQNFFWLLQLLGSLTIGLVGDLGIWCAGRKKKEIREMDFLFWGRDEGIRTLDLCNVTAAL